MAKPSPNNPPPKISENKENIAAVLVFALVIVLIIGFWNNWWDLFETDEAAGNEVLTSIAGQPFKGEPNAPIIIVEYSDFECPFCGKWYEDTWPQIKAEYIDTGKVAMVFKQFPLTQIHPSAMDAAVASECAYEQGNDEFWLYHDLLYANQGNLSIDALKGYAVDAELNQLQFDLCFSNRHPQGLVLDDYREGVQASVTGTPAFIIGKAGMNVKGELLVGAQPFEKFQEVINKI